VDQNGMITTIVGTYSGDIPFDFHDRTFKTQNIENNERFKELKRGMSM